MFGSKRPTRQDWMNLEDDEDLAAEAARREEALVEREDAEREKEHAESRAWLKRQSEPLTPSEWVKKYRR